jgi:threonine synthase
MAQREHTLWRYRELFPIDEANARITMGEGLTPLIRLYPYEELYEHPHLYVKDERQGPTNSFKDRQAVMAVTALHRAGIREVALASAGNAGVAYAAYCARARIKLWLFFSSRVPSEKMREAALYGAEVIKVSGTYDEAKQVAAQFAEMRGIYMDRGAKFIPSKESMKTIAYEIAEQLGLQQNPNQPGTWQSPDWYIQAVSGGIGPLGVWKGFSELFEMGFIDKMPKLGIVQVEGCAPMVKAFQENKEIAEAMIPNTLITVLSTGDPGFSYVQLRKATLSNGGTMIAVTDNDAFQAMRNLARRAGISVEPATAVAFAGLEQLLKDSIITANESVVVNGSGHTFPVESHVLDDANVLNLELSLTPGAVAEHMEEGLGTALRNLDEQITSILLVDDNSSDRRLIRRLLQRYKKYRVYEARNGAEGLMMAQDYRPDLIVADLTMPEMDGFTLLEKLKNIRTTKEIPVVVVSAKALTVKDREVLAEYSDSVWTKGSFDTHALADHVVSLLGDTPIEVIKPHKKVTTAIDTVSPQFKVLIIDDNPRDVRLARRLLESSGKYEVVEATSGQQGLQIVREDSPDLILLDLMMPDMDGFQLLEALQQDDALSEIPVIVVSAKELTQAERDQLRDNIRSLIQKSALDRKQFMATVEQTLVEN